MALLNQCSAKGAEEDNIDNTYHNTLQGPVLKTGDIGIKQHGFDIEDNVVLMRYCLAYCIRLELNGTCLEF